MDDNRGCSCGIWITLVVLMLAGAGGGGYWFLHYSPYLIMGKANLEKEYIKKSIVVEELKNTQSKFAHEIGMKERVLGDLYTQIESLKTANHTLQTELETLKSTHNKELHAAIRGQKIVKVEKKFEDRKLIDRTDCLSFGIGSSTIPASCKERLVDFISKYPNATIELIPVVDRADFDFSDKNLYATEEVINDAYNGLALSRANSAKWLIKETLGNNVEIKFTFIKLEMVGKRGVVLRVYK